MDLVIKAISIVTVDDVIRFIGAVTITALIYNMRNKSKPRGAYDISNRGRPGIAEIGYSVGPERFDDP